MTRFCKQLIVIFVFITACSSRGEGVDATGTLTFIHLNDTYRIDAVEDGTAGGFGRIVTLIHEFKNQGNDVRILHAGDFLSPSLESQLWNGEQMVEALNFMNDIAPMYVVPGNHEIDRRTPHALANAIRSSRFDWLGDNVQLLTGDKAVDSNLRSGFVIQSGDRKIGVVALVLGVDDGNYDREYAPVDDDYLAIASQSIDRLERQGVDAIIGLTHLHLHTDKELAALKAEHPRFLFIAGGHDHEPEHVPATEHSAEVMKGASNARQIWRIDLTFPEDGGIPQILTTRIKIDATIASDPEYDAMARRWRQKLLDIFPFVSARIGTAAVRLDGREAAIRNEESNWGNFIVDQMRPAFGEPAADLAFINSGTLRLDDFVADDITFEDVGRTFGYSSYLRHLVLSGSDFKTLLEAGYRGSGSSQGFFPQISGFRVCIDRSQPVGERITQLQLPVSNEWQQIDPVRDYSVVAPDFLYRGGDGYDFSKAREVSRPGSELKYLVLDAIIRAQAAGEKIGEAIDPQKPRIAMLPAGQQSCFDQGTDSAEAVPR
jgi:5'-nucleotidase